MDASNHQQVFRESLDRCRSCDDFLDRFYVRFMASSGEVREKFLETDFNLQKTRLLESLALAADVVDGDARAMRHLHERAESHGRHGLNIQPRLYDLWLDSLLETAEECDDEFDAELEEAWRAILGHIIGYMRLHY